MIHPLWYISGEAEYNASSSKNKILQKYEYSITQSGEWQSIKMTINKNTRNPNYRNNLLEKGSQGSGEI